MKYYISLILIGITINCACAQTKHEWKVTLKVMDDIGQPVTDANASIGYYTNRTGASIKGPTDTNGFFTASHPSYGGELGFAVEKSGYYTTRESYVLGFTYDPAKWNPTQIIVLKKIGNPIPMYARQARIEVPEVDKPVGFDLIEYDWVTPYGKGKQSDFIFEAHRRFVSWQDFESSFKLTFSNVRDGFVPTTIPLDQGSSLRMPAIAPTNGYQPELSQSLSHTPSGGWKKDEKKDQNYYFRVRSVRDENGDIKSALYGKIYGDFRSDAINSKTILIFFQYYLNPTLNSHNVEFDPKQNLIKDLKPLEGVDAP